MRKMLLGIIFLLSLFTFLNFPEIARAQGASTFDGSNNFSGIGLNTIPEINAVASGVVADKQGKLNSRGLNFNTAADTTATLFLLATGMPDTTNPTTGVRVPGIQGAIPGATRMISSLYESPAASTETYVADLMRGTGLNIAQPAYAQGFGFGSLNPYLETWKTLRNIAYLFYVILFIIIGFMIMFRQKISSQTIVTAQQALPNIIVSLIAVTFSYAIAGLLIDFMYIVMFLIIGLFSTSIDQGTKFISPGNNIFQIGAYIVTDGHGFDAARDAVGSMAAGLINGLAAPITGALNVNNSNQVAQGLSGFLGGGVGLIAAVVFALAMLFSIFRLFFELLKTYISIILAVVLAPIALMLGALPNNNAFSAWLKSLIANLAVFPAILIILILSFMLITPANINPSAGTGQGGTTSDRFQNSFSPPYLFNANSGSSVATIVGLGILLILPDLVAQIKKAIGGSGGIFEQFGNNFVSAVKKGWEGGELVPGLGISNTNKMPGLRNIGGLSGSNIFGKAAIGLGVGTGGLLGMGAGLVRSPLVLSRRGYDAVPEGMVRGGRALGRRIADARDDKELFVPQRKDRKEGKVKYNA